MSDAKVTIILPVYNAQATLERCLDSILNQSYRNLQVIVVNDGSHDKSLEILQRYAQVDERILLLDQPNAGVSAARNAALAVAEGEFIQFADSDDKLTVDATERMVTSAIRYQADLVIADFYRVEDQNMDIKGCIPKEGELSKREFASFLMKEPADYYFGVLWNKLYRRSIIQEHTICCSEELSWCEDFLFNLDYLEYASRFASVKSPVYYYVRNIESLSHKESNFMMTIRMRYKLFEPYKELFENCEMFDQHKMQIRKFFISTARDELVNPAKKIRSDIDGYSEEEVATIGKNQSKNKNLKRSVKNSALPVAKKKTKPIQKEKKEKKEKNTQKIRIKK